MVAVVVKTVVGDILTLRGNDGWVGGGSFDVFQENSFAKLVVRLIFPFAVIVVGAVVDEIWEFCPEHGFVVGHDGGVVSTMGLPRRGYICYHCGRIYAH